MFSVCVPLVPGVRSDSKEVWEHGTKSEECPSPRVDGRGPTETEVRALMKVLIGVDPHKASVAVAAVDEAEGELLERAGFPQDRAGMRRLERWAKRFPERRWAVENAGGLGSAPGGEVGGRRRVRGGHAPKLSARVRVLSSFAGNARKNDGLDALATALAASRNGQLAEVDAEAGSEVPRLLSERREDLVAKRTRALNRLHGLLPDLVPGGVACGHSSADRAACIFASPPPSPTPLPPLSPPLLRLLLAWKRQARLRPALAAAGQVGRSGRGLLPQEDGGGQIPQGGAAVPQAARLRRRLQEPRRRNSQAPFTQRRLTKRSRESFKDHSDE